MNFPVDKIFRIKPASLLCAFLGMALQIQSSFEIWGAYNALRFNLADIVLPLAVLLIGISLLQKKALLPQLSMRYGFLWLVMMTGVMIFALLNGYHAAGEFTHWSLYNKFCGWFVLMAYFMLGAWLVTNLGNDAVTSFWRALLFTFLVIMIGNLTYDVYRDVIAPVYLTKNTIPLEGLMANRNACAFMMIIVMSVFIVAAATKRNILPPFLSAVFFFLLPVLMVYNASRAGVFVMLPLLIAAVFLYGRTLIRPVVIPLLAGLAIVTVMFCVNPGFVLREDQGLKANFLVQAAQTGPLNYQTYQTVTTMRTSDMIRLRVFHDAIGLWQNSPLQGIGLGEFRRFQVSHYPDKDIALFIIDCTPLWLLVETGMIGFAVFFAFACFTIAALWRKHIGTIDDVERLRRVTLFMIAGFAGMCLMHELLYTRILWFMLGLALAVPANRTAPSSLSSS